MKIKIVGDTSMDLSPAAQKELGISCVPFSIQFGETSKKDTTFENEELYAYNDTHKQIAQTSAVNVGEAVEFFQKQKEDADQLFYVSISSKLSSGVQNASIAAQEVGGVTVYDSESFSLGIALLAFKAKEMADAGESDPQVIKAALDEYRQHVVAQLLIDDLSFMARGGRCSKLLSFGANLLKIHPVLICKDGTLQVLKKFRGPMKKLGKKYVDETLACFPEIDKSVVLVGYTSEKDRMVDDAVQALKDAGFEKVYVTKTNSTNACHSGPNSIGFAFLNSAKTKEKHEALLTRIKNKFHKKKAE